jgi:FGGY-family pentulose kinase
MAEVSQRAYLGVDVGTGSARAGLFDRRGTLLGMGVEPIQTWRPEEDFVEQSSDDIWAACGTVVRAALKAAGIAASQVAGIGFDATCSLVALDLADRPVTVSPTGADTHNVVVWMDHRALQQQQAINATGHDVLRYVGGVISVEMETPKLLWLKQNLPDTWRRAARFFDLPDFLVYRATGVDVRSHCTTVCKWTYLGHENQGRGRWSEDYFQKVGLSDLLDDGASKIGSDVRPLGAIAGALGAKGASELGLEPGIPVGVAIIDAHAGGLGLLGVSLAGQSGASGDRAATAEAVTPELLEERLALIGGTSSCHMAVSRDAKFIPGIWGPYFSAMVPGLWLTEGGQSATGALIDHVIASHARAAELRTEAAAKGTNVYALLNGRLDALFAHAGESGAPFPAALARDLHVLPYFHGNRSPRADPTLRGMLSGLKLTDSVDSLALTYLATIQAIAHGTRHIIDTMNAHGYRIRTIVACGGDTKNPVFVREHADITGCHMVLPKASEAVLLGSAILGAVASGDYPADQAGTLRAMSALASVDRVIEPAAQPAVRSFHDAKHAVFQRMFADQIAYRELMLGA